MREIKLAFSLHVAATLLTKQPALVQYYMDVKGIPVPKLPESEAMRITGIVAEATDEKLTRMLEAAGLGGVVKYTRLIPLSEYGVTTERVLDRTHGWMLYAALMDFSDNTKALMGPWCVDEACVMRVARGLKMMDIPRTEENIEKARTWLEEQPE